MPKRQLDKVLVAELGPDWRERLGSFDYEPIAAASIGQVNPVRTMGLMACLLRCVQLPLTEYDWKFHLLLGWGQVHRAVLKDGLVVAMKVQYPGVANSIDSDIENVKRLLDYTNLIPEGLYLDQAMKV